MSFYPILKELKALGDRSPDNASLQKTVEILRRAGARDAELPISARKAIEMAESVIALRNALADSEQARKNAELDEDWGVATSKALLPYHERCIVAERQVAALIERIKDLEATLKGCIESLEYVNNLPEHGVHNERIAKARIILTLTAEPTGKPKAGI